MATSTTPERRTARRRAEQWLVEKYRAEVRRRYGFELRKLGLKPGKQTSSR